MQLPAIYLETTGKLEQQVVEYITTGFHVSRDTNSNETFLLHHGIVRKLIRQCAKELKRPIILCEAPSYFAVAQATKQGAPIPNWRCVQIPKTKYLMPLVNPLLLAAPTRDSRWARSKKDSPIIHNDGANKFWTFTITDPDVWNAWFTNTQTDPDWRKALKLPAKVG